MINYSLKKIIMLSVLSIILTPLDSLKSETIDYTIKQGF